ncbi:MAG: LPS assembly protein LptD [Enterobacteriaceae bacterium]
MKKKIPSLLTAMIWSALYSHYVSASDSLAQQCLLGVPRYDQPLVSGEIESLPVDIESQKSDVQYPDKTTFSGDVVIKQGNRKLTADSVKLQQSQKPGQQEADRNITATGNVKYSDEQIKLNGPKAWSNLNSKDTDVYEGDYMMVNRQGRGRADKLETRDNNRYTILHNGTFTSCLPGDNSWSVVGSEVIHDREEEVAEIWNARFKIGPVPVFYSPYLQLPTGNTRRSGFLIPNIDHSSNGGFGFALPFYWNIAPNYDATITPNYASNRGMQWQNEFRYLGAPGSGLLALDWLPNDRQFEKDEPKKDSTRWLFYWGHNGVMDQVWRFNVDYTKVSDYRYFSDLSSVHGSSTDGYASQKASVGYAEQNWNATLSSKRFQIFTQGGNPDVYRSEPQLDFNYYQDSIGPFDFHTYGQVSRFVSPRENNPEATRWHLQPSLSLPLANSWGSINNEIQLLATHYQQDISKAEQNSLGYNDELSGSINRVLPQFKSDGKLIFERPMPLMAQNIQTLEPRIQYLYIPYKDQNNIYLYDTTLLQADYTGLFRDQSFSGLDRIASANQVSTGITSRIYDESLTERFNISVGQIYYFSAARIGPKDRPDSSLSKFGDKGSRTWAGDLYWKMTPELGLRGGMQYNSNVDNVGLADAVLEYRRDEDRVLQLNYRYASADYITAMLPKLVENSSYQVSISQVGSAASWPIADRWALVGTYYYDTKWKQVADATAGIQYNTCCWSLRLGYERKINEWDLLKGQSKYDNKVSFKFELRGLGGSPSLGSSQMLSAGILPYQRAF